MRCPTKIIRRPMCTSGDIIKCLLLPCSRSTNSDGNLISFSKHRGGCRFRWCWLQMRGLHKTGLRFTANWCCCTTAHWVQTKAVSGQCNYSHYLGWKRCICNCRNKFREKFALPDSTGSERKCYMFGYLSNTGSNVEPDRYPLATAQSTISFWQIRHLHVQNIKAVIDCRYTMW